MSYAMALPILTVYVIIMAFAIFLLQMLSCAHVQAAMSLQQLSPVLCHSLLQHWLVLWYTTV